VDELTDDPEVGAHVVAARFHELVARAYPRAGLRSLEVIAELITWMFLFDDHARRDLLRSRLLSPRAKLSASRLLLQTWRNRKLLDWENPGAAAPSDTSSVAECQEPVFLPETYDGFVHPFTIQMALTPPEHISIAGLLFWTDMMIGCRYFNSPKSVQFLPDGLARQLHVELSARVTEVVRRWDPCVVAWPVGGFRALASFSDSLDPTSRVQLTGDYFGLSVTNNSIASGERAAARLLRITSRPRG